MAASSIKEYLKRYESNNDEEKKKKKKKKKKAIADMQGVLVVDEDPVWQKPVIAEEEHNDSADEEQPIVDEDIEVKRMKRLELLKARRGVGVISEDGSGWVSICDTSINLQANNNNLDLDPPRQRRARNDSASPEPEPSMKADSDLSPSRRPRKRYHSPAPEPRTKLRHHRSLEENYLNKNQDSDISPPRKMRARYVKPSPESDPEFSGSGREITVLSPPRQQQRSHQTLPTDPEARKSHFSNPDLDLSPRRSQNLKEYELNNSDTTELNDISPPRRGRPRKVGEESSSSGQRPKTGLVMGQDLKEEIERARNAAYLKFKEMDPSISGQGAEPVYRDRLTGERISKEEALKSKMKVEKPKEIKLEWGKGLAQKREAEARLQELELEKEKPFARTREDPELDRLLKDRVRWGDPMAHLVKKKRAEPILPDLGEDEKMRESGFIIPQEIPNHSWIKRGLDAAPNRYGIKPGRHWDGVDRSNGFEKQSFSRMNEKQATEREAYLWSVSDM